MSKGIYGILILFFLCIACSYNADDQAAYATGAGLYTQYCSHCHGRYGEGVAKLYPPLAGSSYVRTNAKQMACIIRKGLRGPILVNATPYNLPMPANDSITLPDIAFIMTFVANSWENRAADSTFVRYTADEVRQLLKHCNTH